MCTINTQTLIKTEVTKGFLQPGSVSDIVVFKNDLFSVELEVFMQCQVSTTIMNGIVLDLNDVERMS
jgi:predicted amidohydrolase YtcJ